MSSFLVVVKSHLFLTLVQFVIWVRREARWRQSLPERTGKRGEVVAVIAAGGYVTWGRRSHKMKQTQNAQACSLARDWAASYTLAIGVAAEVTGESGEAGAFSLAR